MSGPQVVAHGGGVQSTGLLVLAAQRVISFRTFVFCNVGDDSEDPATLDYLHRVAMPYAKAHGLRLHVIDRRRRDGSIETLYGRLIRPGSRSLPIPVRMSSGAPGTRSCTADFKVRVLGRWLRRQGASYTNRAVVAVGISLDELDRAHNRRTEPYEHVVYPLLDMRLTRADCLGLIAQAGLPPPPKSACWFCPYRTPASWLLTRQQRPDLFIKACRLEDLLNQRRAALGRDPVWLTRFNRPLEKAIAEGVHTLPGMADEPTGDITCDNGACWT